MSSQVRRVGLGDIEDLMCMMVAMREESPSLKYIKVDKMRTFTNIESMLDSGTFLGVISEQGCMLGIIGSNWYSDKVEAFEQMLYVWPCHRGKTAAYRLVVEFEKLCFNEGAKAIHVGSSTGISDDRTARFYRGIGYTDAGISLRKEL